MAFATGEQVGFRPAPELDAAWTTWPRGDRPAAVREAGAAFRRRFAERGQVHAIRTVDLASTVCSLDFSALIGDPAHRQIVIADRRDAGESVVWLDERNGREVARSPTLSDVPAPGNIVTPGFDRRFFYVSARGALWELRAR